MWGDGELRFRIDLLRIPGIQAALVEALAAGLIASRLSTLAAPFSLHHTHTGRKRA